MSITPALLDTILTPLALLFLTGAVGDITAARQAASQMLAAYNAETPEELRLAAEIITFSFHSLEALSQAADPALSLNQKTRLRGSAVSLSRESHKSQRKLDQLQRARRTPAGAPPAETAAPDPDTEQAVALVKCAKEAIQTAKRIAENLRKNQAKAAQTETRVA
jgi:hypothetical protein